MTKIETLLQQVVTKLDNDEVLLLSLLVSDKTIREISKTLELPVECVRYKVRCLKRKVKNIIYSNE